MSIADPFTVVVVNEMSSKSDGDLAPQYAMKVALQTLRDRCTKLQTRISRLEEENLQFRIELGKDKGSVEEGIRQNLNYIDTELIVHENDQDLWAIVTQNCKEKSQPNSKLIALTKASDEFPISKSMSSNALKNEDLKLKEDSLEEISLRGSGYGRTDDAPRERSEGDDLDEDTDCGEEDLESLDMTLKDILKRMKRDQEILKQQQEGLKSALAIFKKFMKENTVCKTCLKREENSNGRENKIVGTEESLVGRNDREGYRVRERIRIPVPSTEESPPLKDRICPLCEKYFHCSTPFDTFNEHVLSHFVEDEEEENSLNYKVVT